MSASVVDQLETEIRIASIPCHRAAGHPARALALDTGHDGLRERVPTAGAGRLEPDEDLVQHDFIEDANSGSGGELVGHPPRQAAAALDERSDPCRQRPGERAPERGQVRPGPDGTLGKRVEELAGEIGDPAEQRGFAHSNSPECINTIVIHVIISSARYT
jgi:hypothetical protein